MVFNLACNCTKGSSSIACDSKFQCSCKTNFKGLSCSSCNDNFYNYPTCQSCQCSPHGSVSLNCNSAGKCGCNIGYSGVKCNDCADGFNKTQTGECISRKFLKSTNVEFDNFDQLGISFSRTKNFSCEWCW